MAPILIRYKSSRSYDSFNPQTGVFRQRSDAPKYWFTPGQKMIYDTTSPADYIPEEGKYKVIGAYFEWQVRMAFAADICISNSSQSTGGSALTGTFWLPSSSSLKQYQFRVNADKVQTIWNSVRTMAEYNFYAVSPQEHSNAPSNHYGAIYLYFELQYEPQKCQPVTGLQINRTVLEQTIGLGQTALLQWVPPAQVGRDKNGVASPVIGYQVYRSETNNGTFQPLGQQISIVETQVLSPPNHDGVYYYKVVPICQDASLSGLLSEAWVSPALHSSIPILITQAQIDWRLPRKGREVVARCTPAQFMYHMEGYHMAYQWFCSTTETFSASNLIGRTTGTEFEYDEAELLLKGATGAAPEGTRMYLFVRAVYTDDVTFYGQVPVQPSGDEYFYFPWVYPPDNVTLSKAAGASVTITWTPKPVSSGALCETVIFVNGQAAVSYDKDSPVRSHTFDMDYWAAIPSIMNTISIAHIWYGTTASSPNYTFLSRDAHSSIYYYDGANWIPCSLKRYTGEEWQTCRARYRASTQWA